MKNELIKIKHRMGKLNSKLETTDKSANELKDPNKLSRMHPREKTDWEHKRG